MAGVSNRWKEAYDSREQEVHHLTLWEHLTFLRVRRYRGACPTWGVVTAALPCVAREARITLGLADLVAELGTVRTHQAVRVLQGLHLGTVTTMDQRRSRR